MNSTGLDLSQADLIRNFILMRLPEKEQTELYENYWSKIEALFRGSERTFDSFVRDFIALRVQASKQEKASEIYFAFRREFGAIGSDPTKLVDFLKELLRFARYHAAFSTGSDKWPDLRESLARLRRLVDVPAIVIMQLFDCYEKHGTLSASEFVEAVGLLESFVFRRALCGEQTRGYWQIFANLAYRIDIKKPLESLKVRLALMPESYTFPGDAEFRSALEGRDIYHMRVCFDLLDSLENRGTKEPTDTSKYSIEHIMPQNEKLALMGSFIWRVGYTQNVAAMLGREALHPRAPLSPLCRDEAAATIGGSLLQAGGFGSHEPAQHGKHLRQARLQ